MTHSSGVNGLTDGCALGLDVEVGLVCVCVEGGAGNRGRGWEALGLLRK